MLAAPYRVPPLRPQPKRKERMKFIDTSEIPFPKNVEELAALDATREVPYLKALCNRRFIGTPGPNPTPAQIIPIIQQRLDLHLTQKPSDCSDHAGLMLEWKLILEDLQEFLTNLRSLLSETPKKVGPAVPSGPRAQNTLATTNADAAYKNPTQKHAKTRGHSNNPNPTPTKTPAIQTNQSSTTQTLGHSNNSPQKISSPSASLKNHQSSPHVALANNSSGQLTCGGLGKPIINHQSPPPAQPEASNFESQ